MKFLFFLHFDYEKKPAGFFFRRIPTYCRNFSPSRKAAVRLKKLSAEQQDTPISGACEQAHAKACM